MQHERKAAWMLSVMLRQDTQTFKEKFVLSRFLSDSKCFAHILKFCTVNNL